MSTGDDQNARLVSTGDAQNKRLTTTGDTQNKRLSDTGYSYVSTMTTLKNTTTLRATEANNSAELSKKWAVSETSPDGASDSKSSKTWAENARQYASNSASSASAAASSATDSQNSASSSASSATIATQKATAASTSASNAATSATNAKASETKAASSASAAASSATDSQNSASSSASSATIATQKATAASTSASNAATSATNAKASETKAASSASAAAQSAENAKTWNPTSYYTRTEVDNKISKIFMEKLFEITIKSVEASSPFQIMNAYNIHVDGYKPLAFAEVSFSKHVSLEDHYWDANERAVLWGFNHGGAGDIRIKLWILYVKDTFR